MFAFNLLLLPLHRIDGWRGSLQPVQHSPVLVGDAIEFASAKSRGQAARLQPSFGEPLSAQIAGFGVYVEHLLEEDTVLELNFLSTVLLELFRLELVVEMRLRRRRPVV